MSGTWLQPHTFPRLQNERGTLQPHRAGNGSGVAGAETWGARAKKAARPGLTRPSKAQSVVTLLPVSCLLYSVSLELSRDDLAALKQDLWQYSLLPFQASINHRLKDTMSGTSSTETPLVGQKSPRDFGRNSRFTLSNGPEESLCSKVKPSYLWP